MEVSEQVDEIGARIVDGAFHVHRALGPGLLESVYQKSLEVALSNRGLKLERERWIDLEFEGVIIPRALRIDLLVEGEIIVEVKAVENLLPVHEAQVLSQLKLTALPLGYLINFNTPWFKQGIRRFANTRTSVGALAPWR